MQANTLFTAVNDRIRLVAGEFPKTQTWDFICECREVNCEHSVSLTLTDFDERRAASPPVPVLAPEHDD